MNAWLNPINIWSYSAHGRFFHNETDLGLMGSANTWLFMDENPYSIDDAYMPEYPPPGPSTTANLRWVGYPASYHDGGATIVFCDGHGLIKKWTDPVVLNMRFENPSALAATTNNPDLPWLQAVSTRGQ
jgi:prepilin-type processing-associated H-X9-DG protein